MSGDGVTAHVAAQQKKWEEYLAKHNVEKLYRDMTAEMIGKQPEEPIRFIFEYLKTNYPSECGVTKMIPENYVSLSQETKEETKIAPIEAEEKAAPEEEDDEDDEEEDDDEDDYADFIEIKKMDPNKKRGSVVAERVVVDESWVPPEYEKAAEKEEFLAEILPKLFFLSGLTRKEINVLVKAMKPISFDAGTAIINQGEEGDMFYIVENGVCDIEVDGVGKVMEIPCPSKDDPNVLRRYFGELALLYDAPRAATVKARDNVTTWALDRKVFKSILQDTASKQRLLYGDFLKKVPLFQNIHKTPEDQEKFIDTLCESLKAVDYAAGDIVIQEGQQGNDFFIIEAGEAACTKRVNDKNISVCPVLTSGAFFGELALLKDVPRAATVTANTPLSCVKIDRATFKRMIGNIGEINIDYQTAAN